MNDSTPENVSLNVVGAGGKKVGTKKVSAEIFASGLAEHSVYQTVRWQGAKRRAGTHTVKTRSEVRGGGAKPWRQKGTGRARAGSSSSPIWVGGGVAHGPKQRSYEYRVNKKERELALKSALSVRFAEQQVLLVEDLGIKEVKTKVAQAALLGFGIERGMKVLIVLPDSAVADENQVVAKSLRNIAGAKPVAVSGLNVRDILDRKLLVIVGDALEGIQARLGVE